MKCSWKTGCSNPDVRTFWWFCRSCGQRIAYSTDRCDYHRPLDSLSNGIECRRCQSASWRWVEYKMFDPFDAVVSMREFLAAGVADEEG